MAWQLPTGVDDPGSAPGPPGMNRLWLVLGAVAAVAVTVALLPLLLPAVAGSLAGSSPQAYWYLSRASAFVAFGLLWISMLAGLGITGAFARRWPGLTASFELHRITGLLGVGFALLHALVLLGDHYIGYNLGQILVPFLASPYRPEWVGFGQVALYVTAVVAGTFYIRDRLGLVAWRLIHMLSFALFLMILVHGLNSGTDSTSLWARVLYWGSGVSVLWAAVYRLWATRRGRARDTLAATGLIVGGARSRQPRVGPARPTADPTPRPDRERPGPGPGPPPPV